MKIWIFKVLITSLIVGLLVTSFIFYSEFCQLRDQVRDLKTANAELETDNKQLKSDNQFYLDKLDEERSKTKLDDLTAYTINEGDVKTYMDYRKITDPTSPQYNLQKSAETNNKGLRELNGKPMVAVSEKFGYVGDEIIIEYGDGTSVCSVIGDIKKVEHLDPTKTFVPEDGNVVEFIVDVDNLPSPIKVAGDVSALGYQGKVKKILEV